MGPAEAQEGAIAVCTHCTRLATALPAITIGWEDVKRSGTFSPCLKSAGTISDNVLTNIWMIFISAVLRKWPVSDVLIFSCR